MIYGGCETVDLGLGILGALRVWRGGGLDVVWWGLLCFYCGWLGRGFWYEVRI